MLHVQKLSALGPEMKAALRRHIIRKRRRFKQEIEQNAIEERLKRQRAKCSEDSMTLDQISEQLSFLETKLQSLRVEKHHLFVQLKQVLNDDGSKRKKGKQASKPVDLARSKTDTSDDLGPTIDMTIKMESFQEQSYSSRRFHDLGRTVLISNFPNNLPQACYPTSSDNRVVYSNLDHKGPLDAAYLNEQFENQQISPPSIKNLADLSNPFCREEFLRGSTQSANIYNLSNYTTLDHPQGITQRALVGDAISSQMNSSSFYPHPQATHSYDHPLYRPKKTVFSPTDFGTVHSIPAHVLSELPSSRNMNHLPPQNMVHSSHFPDLHDANFSSSSRQYTPQVPGNIPNPIVNVLPFPNPHQ